MPGLLEKNDCFAVGEEEIAAENRQQLLDVLIRLLADADVEVRGGSISVLGFYFDDPLPDVQVRRVGQNVIGVCMNSEEDEGRKGQLDRLLNK